jgi:hypothetical protein
MTLYQKNERTRIKFHMSMLEIFSCLSGTPETGYNPGALSVVTEIFKKAEEVDPRAMMGGMSPLLNLDTCGIYAERIWMLYKDVCDSKVDRVIGVLRAVQLGIVEHGVVQHAVDNRGQGIDVMDLCRQVRDRLVKFNVEGLDSAPAAEEQVAVG